MQYQIDDETFELLDKFDKSIQPKIVKAIDRIDRKKEIFINLFNKNSMI